MVVKKQTNFFLIMIILSAYSFLNAEGEPKLESGLHANTANAQEASYPKHESRKQDEVETDKQDTPSLEHFFAKEKELSQKCPEPKKGTESDLNMSQRCQDEWKRFTESAGKFSDNYAKPALSAGAHVASVVAQPAKEVAKSTLVISPNDGFNQAATFCSAFVTVVTSYFTRAKEVIIEETIVKPENIATQPNETKRSSKIKLRHRFTNGCKSLPQNSYKFAVRKIRSALPYVLGFGTYQLVATNEPVKISICNNVNSATKYVFGDNTEKEKTNLADNPKK